MTHYRKKLSKKLGFTPVLGQKFNYRVKIDIIESRGSPVHCFNFQKLKNRGETFHNKTFSSPLILKILITLGDIEVIS